MEWHGKRPGRRYAYLCLLEQLLPNSRARSLTRLVEHLIALIENEDTNAAETQSLVTNKSFETARSTDNDVGTSLLVLQGLNILLDRGSTVEDTGFDVRHVFAEAVVLIANLVSQLASVAHDDNRDLSVDGLDLLQGGQNEDCSLSQS